MRATLKQIAQAAGVHHTTVSRALKGHRSIPADTRDRIRKIADKFGYRPDAMLSSLIAYRHRVTRPQYQATLAWVTNHATRDGWKEQGIVTPPYQGSVSAIYRDLAEERATELGYMLETFWMREDFPKGKKLSDILKARNITGILLAPQPRARSHTHMDWSCFSTVGLGFSLSYPSLHTVGNNHFDSMTKIMRELKSRGYRRVGLCLFFDMDERVNNHYLAAYYLRARMSGAAEVIPHFWSRKITKSVEKDFNKWYNKYKPDAVISCNWEVYLWLLHRGLRVPKDVGFAMTSVAHPTSICSGIYEYPDQIGVMAVDHLVDMIQRGEQGIPMLPRRILLEGSWIDGKYCTLRPRSRQSGKLEERRRTQQERLLGTPVQKSASFEDKLPDVEKWLKRIPD